MDGLDPGFCWLYDYEEEGHRVAGDTGSASPLGPILRPVVFVEFQNGSRRSSQQHAALVDSGANSILTPAWMAMDLGIELDDIRRTTVGLGGKTRAVRYADVTVRLIPPDDRVGDDPISWPTPVGFMDWDDPPWNVLLGQSGFFNTFTVTMNRHAQRLAIRPVSHFDAEHGLGLPREAPDAVQRRRL